MLELRGHERRAEVDRAAAGAPVRVEEPTEHRDEDGLGEAFKKDPGAVLVGEAAARAGEGCG